MPAAPQLRPLRPLRGRSPGRDARAALCGAEQRDFGRRRVADRPGGAARSVCPLRGL